MANPTLPSKEKMFDFDNMFMEVDGVIVNDKQVVSTQQATIVDAAAATASNPTAPAALTQVAVTDALDGATFTGTALTTSGTPTVDELEAIAGMLGLAVNAAGTDLAALRTEVISYETAISALIVDVALIRTAVNAIIAALDAHGLTADA